MEQIKFINNYRAAQKLNLGGSSKQKSKKSSNRPKHDTDTSDANAPKNVFTMNVSELIMRTPPHAPPSLFKSGISRRGDCHGKVSEIFIHLLIYRV